MTSSDSMPLPDQAARDRFCHEINRNFSVVAPAGVGKTRAIVNRIVNLALKQNLNSSAEKISLVVVTYTRKAAKEMEERARKAILEETQDIQKVHFLNQVFWGTIHSFAYELIKQYGFHLGIPSQLDLAENTDALWLSFYRSLNNWDDFWPSGCVDTLKQYVQLKTIADLVKRIPYEVQIENNMSGQPIWDPSVILNYVPSKRNELKVLEGKALLQRFLERIKAGEKGLSIPHFKQGGKEFAQLWSDTLKPLKDWVAQGCLVTAQNIAKAFFDYRLKRSKITYDDISVIALMLLKHPEVGRAIRSRNYSVILDEAQDTDSQQFHFLLELTRPNDATGLWREVQCLPPEQGRFCMVGDPQQSIYGGRADLNEYRSIHEQLLREQAAEELIFKVTMRCEQAIVAVVNKLFPCILEKNQNQVSFVELQASSWAGQGQVAKIGLPSLASEELSVDDRMILEAQFLAQWLAEKNISDWGLKDWSEIAFLCPRKKWLVPIAKVLKSKGFKVQIHSREDRRGESPSFAWLTALVAIMADPLNSFEITGVLREIFGVSDHDMGMFVCLKSISEDSINPIQILKEQSEKGIVEDVLQFLYLLRDKIIKLPLYEAIEVLCAETALLMRIQSLGDYDPEEMKEILDIWLCEAIIAEMEGHTLVSWSEVLRELFNTGADETDVLDDHIQLYTCHKSKGLEWSMTIIPFLFRDLKSRPVQYPVVCNNQEDKMKVYWDSSVIPEDQKYFMQSKEQAEYERLLYVACTRPKKALVFVDDEKLFDSEGKSAKCSLASLLKIDKNGENRSSWERIGIQLSALSKKVLEGFSNAIVINEDIKPFKQVSITKAVNASRQYCKHITPSSLAFHSNKKSMESKVLSIEGEDVACERGGRDYGNWWHHVMECMPWDEGINEWRSYGYVCLEKCPLPGRGQKEIDLFLASELAQIISGEKPAIKTEVSFLKSDDGKVYEGIMDCVLFFKNKKEWWVVDWKTDILPGGVESLKEVYAPQIQLYVDAAKEYWNASVKGILYSTRLGEMAMLA